jgi:hypothetical protein
MRNTSKIQLNLANEYANSPVAWCDLQNTLTENQKPLEFSNHRFLIQPFNDMSSDQVYRKSAQVGVSTIMILKVIWLAEYRTANSIYVLPTNNVVKDFVTPKVDPLINGNYHIEQIVSKDSVSLKQVGNRFIYFKGSFSERDAIAISGDILVLDEYDRMSSMNVVNTYDSRLQASELGWRWRLSNPSQVGFGVDALFQDSDQMHWFITCHHCNHEWFIDFEQTDNKNHYINQELKLYVCGKCSKPLTDDDRRGGRWVAKYPSRKRRGYWISQLMAPWVSAERILEQKEESNIEFFHNFVLGTAYTASDLIVNRETILRATAPSDIPKLNVVMGVDQNVSEQIWVAATPQGIFAHGRTTSWEELERLKLMWNAIVVIDPAPYPTMPKKLADKYPDIYLCYFKEHDGLSITTTKGQKVYADRTRLLDTVANEFTAASLLIREKPYELEDYIADWQNIYRTTVEDPDGRSKSKWLKKDNKESDFSLATAYMRIALSFVIDRQGSKFIEPLSSPDGITTDEITDLQETSLSNIVEETFNQIDENY